MKHSILSFLTVVLLAGAVNNAAQAQSIQIGYADPEIIITYMPEYQNVQQQMAIEYRTSQEALQALAEDFQERLDRYGEITAVLDIQKAKLLKAQTRFDRLFNVGGEQKLIQEQDQWISQNRLRVVWKQGSTDSNQQPSKPVTIP